MYKNPVIIINRKSGRAKKKKNVDKLINMVKDNFQKNELNIFEFTNKIETINFVVELHSKKNHDLIIAAGGDGTISAVCNALMNIKNKKERIPVLPLPFGSGNSFLRDFKIYTLEQTFKSFTDGAYEYMDILKVTLEQNKEVMYCTNVIGMGFICEIAKYAVSNKKRFGGLSYILGTFLALKKFIPYKTTIYRDKSKKETLFESNRVFFLTVSNSQFSGGAIQIAPKAVLNDGKMDVIALHDINRKAFLSGFLRSLKGNHLSDNGCDLIQTDKIYIESEPVFELMPDGELEKCGPLEVEVLREEIPLALKII